VIPAMDQPGLQRVDRLSVSPDEEDDGSSLLHEGDPSSVPKVAALVHRRDARGLNARRMDLAAVRGASG